jgi:conjugal transfer/type IV secretion protein DotA/TraY
MISLFDLASKDQSIVYLSQIFGQVGGVIPTSQGTLLFSIMFQVINTMALVVGTLLVVYITVIGVLSSAHEGEFMGKKWSGLWVPIRMVFGIIALFPTKTGYAAIQIIFMWIIVQGVGAADKLWTSVLQFSAVTGSPYQTIDTSSIQKEDIKIPMRSLFQSLTCQATARAAYNDVRLDINKSVSYFCKSHSGEGFCKRPDKDLLNIINGPQVGLNTYHMGPADECGSLSYCDESASCKDTNSLECLTCQAQKQILQTIVTTFGGQIGPKFAEVDNNYLVFHQTAAATTPSWVANYCSASNPPISAAECCNITSPAHPTCTGNFRAFLPYISADNLASAATNTVKQLYYPSSINKYLGGSDVISAATDAYVTSLVSAVNTYYQAQMKNVKLDDWQAAAQERGWILAGAYYYRMANANTKRISALKPSLGAQGFSSNPSSLTSDTRNNYKASEDLLAAIRDAAASTSNRNSPAQSLPSEYADVSAAVGNASSTLLATFINNMTNNSCVGADCSSGGNVNPLASIATFGYQMMITAQLLFWVLTLTAVLMTVGLTVNPMVLGTGLTLNPFGEGVKAAISFVGPFVTILISSIYTLGVMLGIYVPLIPYVIFSMGAIGWMIGTIEAMVASPFVALGILSPAGQHEILGRAEPAVMMLFNIFLRPSLMVFGLMAAMLMSIVVVKMINAGFLAITTTIIKYPGLFETIAFIAAYTSLLITALNKTFSLIYMIPERVLTWIGGQAVSYGEGEALGEVKRGVEGAGSASAGAGKQAGSGLASSGEGAAMSAAKRDYKDKQKAAALQAKQKDKDKDGGGGP